MNEEEKPGKLERRRSLNTLFGNFPLKFELRDHLMDLGVVISLSGFLGRRALDR